MKTFFSTLLASIIFVSLGSLCVADEKQDAYKIGVILPLTGDNASLGQFLRNGIELAHRSLPEEQQRKLSLVFEDDQLQASKAVAAYRKLRTTDGIKAVIVLGSGDGHAVAPLAEEDKVILFAVGASDINVVKGKRFAFIHWIAPEKEASVLAEEIQKRNYRRAAFMTLDQQGCIAMRDAIEEQFRKRGMEKMITLDEVALPGMKDFNTFISKARAKGVDVVVTVLMQGSLSAFAKQVKQQRLKADLAGAETFEDESEVKASEGGLLGQWYVNVDDAQDFFVRQYMEAFKEVPGWGAASAYDSIRLLAQGVEKYGRENEKISDFLRNLKDYSGAAGTYSATGDNRFDLPAAIKIVEESGFRKINQQRPQS